MTIVLVAKPDIEKEDVKFLPLLFIEVWHYVLSCNIIATNTYKFMNGILGPHT